MGRLPCADDPLSPAEAVSLAYVEARDRRWQDLLLAVARVVEVEPRPDVADRVALMIRRAVLAGEPLRLDALAEIDVEEERDLLTRYGARVPVDRRRSA